MYMYSKLPHRHSESTTYVQWITSVINFMNTKTENFTEQIRLYVIGEVTVIVLVKLLV